MRKMDALAYDPHKFAMDYHNIGFRECAAEVARYLVTVEGMDIQDPLRLRLMSHLQCFAAQRELATKQAAVASASPWSYGGTGGTQHYPSSPGSSTQMIPPPPPPPSMPQHGHHDTSNMNSPAGGTMATYDITSTSSPSCGQTSSSSINTSSSTSRHQGQSQTTLTPLTTATSASPLGYSHHQYHMNLNSFPTTSGLSHHQNPFNSTSGSSQMKPYRPWGAEVAY
ncbi:hypothetical protein C0J52_18557 [Blattella germanica]|nr:hypothetical protein C0J52_18557 [Blattella germanica]